METGAVETTETGEERGAMSKNKRSKKSQKSLKVQDLEPKQGDVKGGPTAVEYAVMLALRTQVTAALVGSQEY